MKLWLLDADVIIDLLAYGVFDLLVDRHDIQVAETVAAEVEFYKVRERVIPIDFKSEYIESGRVKCLTVGTDSYQKFLNRLPSIIYQGMDDGEQESLAALLEHEDLTFCTCDKAAIISLPFLECEDRAISTENLLKASGLTTKNLEEKHSEKYFKRWLGEGHTRKMYYRK